MKRYGTLRGLSRAGVGYLVLWQLGQIGVSSLALASLQPEKVYFANLKKTEVYIRDGLITGGDQTTQDFTIKDIRRAKNVEFERVVIDLSSNSKTEANNTIRAPYYQVALTPREKRLILTLFGKPKLSFNPSRVQNAFKRSTIVHHLDLLPLVDESSWTFAVEMNADHPVEVFELSNPPRIIIDIK